MDHLRWFRPQMSYALVAATAHTRAPMVDFESHEDFERAYQRSEATYAKLICKIVDEQSRQVVRPRRYEWTTTEEMGMGLANFEDMEERGLRIVLRLTRDRGLSFCLQLNHCITVAATAACRTYCDMHKDACMERWMADTSWNTLSDAYVEELKQHMIRALSLAMGDIEDRHSMAHALHRKCFAVLQNPHDGTVVWIPRKRVGDWKLALCCIAHERMGCSADGAPLAGQALREDTLRMIVDLIDFH